MFNVSGDYIKWKELGCALDYEVKIDAKSREILWWSVCPIVFIAIDLVPKPKVIWNRLPCTKASSACITATKFGCDTQHREKRIRLPWIDILALLLEAHHQLEWHLSFAHIIHTYKISSWGEQMVMLTRVKAGKAAADEEISVGVRCN